MIETPLFPDDKSTLNLIRRRDHKEEKADLLVDYLDYQKDNLIRQISVDTPALVMILHK
jgi:hypothetical protein